MIPGGLGLTGGLGLRPARPADAGFFETLYKASRDDIRMADAVEDYIELVIDQQYESRQLMYERSFPNAWHFVIELHSESVGRLVLDFGPNEVRVVDILFAKHAQGRGYGRQLLLGLQKASAMVRTPLTLTVNPLRPRLKQFYADLGFVVEDGKPTAELMVWYPSDEGMPR